MSHPWSFVTRSFTRKTIDSVVYLKLEIMVYLKLIALPERPELVSDWSLFDLNCRSKCCPSRHAAWISMSRSMFYILSLQTGFKFNYCPAWDQTESLVTNCKTPAASYLSLCRSAVPLQSLSLSLNLLRAEYFR